LGLDDIANDQRADVAAVFEIARIEGMLALLVKDLTATLPHRKQMAGSDADGAGDVLIFVVLFGSLNDAVLNHVADDLGDLIQREGNVGDQARAVLNPVFFPSGKGWRTGQKPSSHNSEQGRNGAGSVQPAMAGARSTDEARSAKLRQVSSQGKLPRGNILKMKESCQLLLGERFFDRTRAPMQAGELPKIETIF
jgi:hypothetical protein